MSDEPRCALRYASGGAYPLGPCPCIREERTPSVMSASPRRSREIELDKLGPGDEDLIRVASLARQRAHAPYSKYKVGAAVRTKRNKIYSGANVENASYGLTVCAERCAVWAAVAAGETKDYDAIAIVIDDDKLPTPCGACRQVIAEFAPDARVVLATTSGLRKTTTLTALLPEPFLPGNLS